MLAVIVGMALVASPSEARGAIPDKPNIVFILADDLGYGDLGCYGQATIQTPRLDALAREGMRFTQFYSGACSCAPARCVLMTGFHTGHAAVRLNAEPNTPLRIEDITVAELLKGAGYRTALIGKWGLGGEDADGNPCNVHSAPWNKGFDFSYGYLDQELAHDYYPEWLWRTGDKQFLPANADGATGVNAHNLFSSEAQDFVTDADEPFYLQLSYTVPHKNLIDSPVDTPYATRPWPEIEKHFATMISRMDADIGQLVDAIDARGIAPRTLIIFTSDNGPQQKEGHLVSFFDSNGPLRGRKFDLYEGGIREPFIARWSGVIPAGIISDHVAAFEDFMPTAAELAGVAVPRGIDGISFLSALLDQGGQQAHEHLYWEYGSWRAARWGSWKAVQYLGNPLALYDLSVDIGEQYDVSGQYPAIAARIGQIMDDSHSSGPTAVVAPSLKLAGDVVESGGDYSMDFGGNDAKGDMVTRVFRVRNDAPTYAHLMEGNVLAGHITDPRLRVDLGSYGFVPAGGASGGFTITFTPGTGEPPYGQWLIVSGREYVYRHDAQGSPVKLILGEPPVPGDFDLDHDVDLEDFGFLQRCFSGTGSQYEPGCEDADLSRNGAVDCFDLRVFLECFAGPNVIPDC